MVLMTVVPPALVVRLVSAVPMPPTMPLKVVRVEEFTFRLKAPLRVLPKEMLPAPASRMVSALRVTASL